MNASAPSRAGPGGAEPEAEGERGDRIATRAIGPHGCDHEHRRESDHHRRAVAMAQGERESFLPMHRPPVGSAHRSRGRRAFLSTTRCACAIVLAWLVAGTASGEEATPSRADSESASPALEEPLVTEPPPGAPPSSPGDRWGPYGSVGWDDAPTYEFGYRPFVERYDPTGFAREIRVTGRVGGRLQLDGGVLGGAPVDDGVKGEVRRAQLWLRGDITFHRPVAYKFGFAFEDDAFFLNDFWLRWHFQEYVDTVRFGYFDPPIGLDVLGGSSDRVIMEVGSPSAAFAPGFRLGLETTGSWRPHDVSWFLNLSSVGQSQKVGDASDAPLRAVARAVWHPVVADAGAPETRLHVGGSVSFSLGGGGGLEYRSRPESFLADYVVDTGELSGSATLVATELAWRRGPLLAQSEIFTNLVDEDERGGLVLWGAYLGGTWALTGEPRPYDPEGAVFLRTVPARPFSPARGGWGALELGGRISWLDLSDGGVHGGRMFSLNLGPTWTLNRFVRVQAGYVWAHVRDVPDRGNAHVLQSRLDLTF